MDIKKENNNVSHDSHVEVSDKGLFTSSHVTSLQYAKGHIHKIKTISDLINE